MAMTTPATSTVRRPATAAAVVLGGAVLALVGMFVTWFELTSAGQATTYVGTDSTAGAGTAGFSVVLIIAGILLFVRSRKGLGRGWAIATIVIAAFVTFLVVYSAAAPEDSVVQFEASSVSEQFGVSEEQAKEAIRSAVKSGQLQVASGPGAWVSAVGALVALVGGILGVRALPKRGVVAAQPMSAPPPPPPPAP
jgi:hypothetical protein